MPHRTNVSPAPTPVRWVARTLAFVIATPLMWGVSRLNWHGRLMQAVGKRMIEGWERNSPFKGYEATAHDVFVCTYVKSGTNWMMQLVHQLAWRGRGEYEHIHDVVAWPDAFRPDFAVKLNDASVWRSSPTGLWAIKTHQIWKRIPYSPEARYIYIVRDPKEVVVSAYYFAKDGFIGPLMPPKDSWVELSMQPYFFGGDSWAEHVAEFWAQRHRPNVLILSYKEMKANFPLIAQRVADFLAVTLTPDEMVAVLAQCDFNYMKANGHKFNTGAPPWVAGKGTMIRQGQVGKSSELLTPAQQQQIDRHWKAELRRLGSDFPYEEVFERKA